MGPMFERADPAELGFCPRRLARIDAWMARYIDAGKIPGGLTLVARDGQLAYLACRGQRDREAGLPLLEDTIFRFYSMTKPITAVAVMMLYEEGLIRLDDPLAASLPEFTEMSVYRSGEGAGMETEPAAGPITIHHLLQHTSGLTYGFMDDHPVALLYRAADLDFNPQPGDLAARVARLAKLPLRHQPGSAWAYSVSFDVLGRVVEAVTGEPLDRFFSKRIFQPLGMSDTAFHLPAVKLDRLAALYGPAAGDREGDTRGIGASIGTGPGLTLLEAPAASKYLGPVGCFSGGGGLLSTAADYLRFAEMLRRGGELEGQRLLGPRTVDFMTRNHLPGGCDLAAMGQSRFSETSYRGIGFGLGMSVVLDPGQSHQLSSPGEYAWGGAASTCFWVDPLEGIVAIFLTQLLPSDSYPLRQELRTLVYQALLD